MLKRALGKALQKALRWNNSAGFLSGNKNLAEHDIGEWSHGHLTVHSWANSGRLKIGKFCSLGNLQIFLGGEHRVDWVTTYAFPTLFAKAAKFPGHPLMRGDLVIGNDVWAGEGAMIMAGVTIGDGAVIGARSVVRRDVPPYAIIVGNPGRVAGFRFDKEMIEALLEISWWDWPLEKIEEAWPLMLNTDIEAFVAKYGKKRGVEEEAESGPV